MSHLKFMVLRCLSYSAWFNDGTNHIEEYSFNGVKLYDSEEAAFAECERLNIDAMRSGFTIHWSNREYNDHKYYQYSDQFLKSIAEGHEIPDALDIAQEAETQSYGNIYLSDRAKFDEAYKILKEDLPYVVRKVVVNN